MAIVAVLTSIVLAEDTLLVIERAIPTVPVVAPVTMALLIRGAFIAIVT